MRCSSEKRMGDDRAGGWGRKGKRVKSKVIRVKKIWFGSNIIGSEL